MPAMVAQVKPSAAAFRSIFPQASKAAALPQKKTPAARRIMPLQSDGASYTNGKMSAASDRQFPI